jgi:phage shock protein A
MSFKQMAVSFDEQIADQKTQVELLRDALNKLEQKIAEAEGKAELLIAQHRRSKAVGRASDASAKAGDKSAVAAFDRMKNKVQREEAISQAKAEVEGSDDLDRKFARMEKEEQVEQLLLAIKQRKSLTA